MNLVKNSHFVSFSNLKWINFEMRTAIWNFKWSICNLAGNTTGKNTRVEALFLTRTQGGHFYRISHQRCHKWSIWPISVRVPKLIHFRLKKTQNGHLILFTKTVISAPKSWKGGFLWEHVVNEEYSSTSILATFLSVRMIPTLIWWFDWNVLNMKNHCN